jgi:hypothetical protein
MATEPLEYILANPNLFKINLVCKITDVDENIDSCVMKGSHENIGYIQTELDFCIYLEAIAYTNLDDIPVNVRLSFGENRNSQKELLEFYSELLQSSEAVLVTGDTFCIVHDEFVFYDPEIKKLEFKF